MRIRVQTEDFDVGAELAQLRAGNPKIGAIASFVGLVRDLNENAEVSEMILEHYPAMTQKSLEGIVAEAKNRWDIYDALVIHRVGKLVPTDQIVLVAVTSSHRGEAFAACEFIMDYLKTQAPFWKKEQTTSGSRWVDSRESDDKAAQRWETKIESK
ncbi:molybdopterin synthase catalytic subunit MoaE [Sulfurirhabdus autotrophica]|uniref:Molybdopterin synthase catalytic subunit n=1 Tax=Sulfurirhabdus autotrophica TaxID=1706046 RepID=A0A4R3Y837_9PROT|nr:molybdopterin synthase catalytic subunit MoaE [Sulfurirhabdus autotrophica]TCV86734.1 molybdopterin synthase subunit MoaE [Sulfurirhabdus autotrophica]